MIKHVYIPIRRVIKQMVIPTMIPHSLNAQGKANSDEPTIVFHTERTVWKLV